VVPGQDVPSLRLVGIFIRPPDLPVSRVRLSKLSLSWVSDFGVQSAVKVEVSVSAKRSSPSADGGQAAPRFRGDFGVDSGETEAQAIPEGEDPAGLGVANQGLNLLARVAWDGVQDKLATFRCVTDPEADDPPAWEAEVEEWIQNDAWNWFQAQVDDPRLLIVVEESDPEEPLAVVGHEAWGNNRFLPALGVHSDFHRRYVGLRTMETAFEDARTRVAWGAFALWFVDPNNEPSQNLSTEKLKAAWTKPPEYDPLILYKMPLFDED
jgi:hypothetical protein